VAAVGIPEHLKAASAQRAAVKALAPEKLAKTPKGEGKKTKASPEVVAKEKLRAAEDEWEEKLEQQLKDFILDDPSRLAALCLLHFTKFGQESYQDDAKALAKTSAERTAFYAGDLHKLAVMAAPVIRKNGRWDFPVLGDASNTVKELLADGLKVPGIAPRPKLEDFLPKVEPEKAAKGTRGPEAEPAIQVPTGVEGVTLSLHVFQVKGEEKVTVNVKIRWDLPGLKKEFFCGTLPNKNRALALWNEGMNAADRIAGIEHPLKLEEKLQKAAAAVRQWAIAQLPRGVCRTCGCTENHGCPGGCSWVDGTETLCSSCGNAAKAGPAMPKKKKAKATEAAKASTIDDDEMGWAEDGR
jgi:hypothetical protein